MSPSLLTLDGVHTCITSVYFDETTGDALAGNIDFIWRTCVDEAPAAIERDWTGPPVVMLRPPRHDLRKDRPPKWRINVLLESDVTVDQDDSGRHAMEGSHLTLVFFRNDVFDMPLDDIIALAVAQIEWKHHAQDWCW